MIAVYLAPVYILVNVYILWRLFRWLGTISDKLKNKKVRIPITLLYIFFATSMLTGFLSPKGNAERILKLIGNYWLGIFLYTVLVAIVEEIIFLILRRTKKDSRKKKIVFGAAGLAAIASISLWGMINARTIRTTEYHVAVDKKVEGMESLKVALVADLHMGYNIGCSQMKQMVEKINALNPDVVVIAGDIFDNEYDALEDPEKLIEILQGIESKYGTYACYGNHDIAEKILAGFTFGGQTDEKVSDTRMDSFLEKAGITLLRDEYVMIEDQIYLYGRPDAERPGRGIRERKTAEEITEKMDLTKSVIVLDHEPRELQELADAGVDVDLCGHTHDGQLFPGNITTGLMWENSFGYLKKNDMHNIVTSGVGIFGPFMRVGTIAEVVSVDIKWGQVP